MLDGVNSNDKRDNLALQCLFPSSHEAGRTKGDRQIDWKETGNYRSDMKGAGMKKIVSAVTIIDLIKSTQLSQHGQELLVDLWQELTDKKFFAEYPYPVSHGERHITGVIGNMCRLLPIMAADSPHAIEEEAVFEILFATMIHDIAMCDLKNAGSDSEAAYLCRADHASRERIESYARQLSVFGKMKHAVRERILLMACSHASDRKYTLSQKDSALNTYRNDNPRKHYVDYGSRALRLADLLDIGPDRLDNAYNVIQNWTDSQKHHILKHKYISADIQSRHIQIDTHIDRMKIDVNKDDQELFQAEMEILAVYRVLYDQATQQVRAFCSACDFPNFSLSIEPFDESRYGSIFPVGRNVNLFTMEYRCAKDNLSSHHVTDQTLYLDIMGHSQYARFVCDTEKLNTDIQQILFDETKSTPVRVRILLLDPEIESQQMEEVYDSQLRNEAASRRSILPEYDPEWQVSDGGDIRSSLDSIKQWCNCLKPSARFEVRLTRRNMYAAITRFSDRMIVSPYRSGGRFQATLALRVTQKAPLFFAYLSEFEEIWNHPHQTRIYIFRSPDKSLNPIRERINIKGTCGDKAIRPFEYELSLIDDVQKRDFLSYILGENHLPLAPPEIEIQPSGICSLACEHCIGAYVGHHSHKSVSLSCKGNPCRDDSFLTEYKDGRAFNFDSILNYYSVDAGGHRFQIETVRLSGLTGDPLEEPVVHFTQELIRRTKEAGRKVVLFTNGVAFSKEERRNTLLGLLGSSPGLQDALHISLDAVEPQTFQLMKHGDPSVFESMIEGIHQFCHSQSRKNVQTTLGFVVTQMNAKELAQGAVRLGEKLGADVLRFKPDIRMPRSISYRTWTEFKKQIAQPTNRKPRLVLTEIPLNSSAPPVTEKCWSQYYCPAVGPDGHLYLCDHLSGRLGKAQLGSLYEKSFEAIWTAAWEQLGKRQVSCFLCPPSKNRINRFLTELHSIRQNCPDDFARWLNDSICP